MNRRGARRWIAAVGLVLALASVSAGAAPDPLANRFGGPFTLTGEDGRRVRDSDFRGRFMLVYFGYTQCPDVCPTDLWAIGQALDRLGPLAVNVQPLFVTVDPARDTADLMAEYAKSFHPNLIGLTGSEEEIAAVTRAYRVHRRKVLRSPGDVDYLVDHGSLTYLMGPDGRFVTLFPHGSSVETIAAALRTYLPH